MTRLAGFALTRIKHLITKGLALSLFLGDVVVTSAPVAHDQAVITVDNSQQIRDVGKQPLVYRWFGHNVDPSR
jgi:hypothetical protein